MSKKRKRKFEIKITDASMAESYGMTAQTITNWNTSTDKKLTDRVDALRIGKLFHNMGFDFEMVKTSIELEGRDDHIRHLKENNALYSTKLKQVKDVIEEIKGRM